MCPINCFISSTYRPFVFNKDCCQLKEKETIIEGENESFQAGNLQNVGYGYKSIEDSENNGCNKLQVCNNLLHFF